MRQNVVSLALLVIVEALYAKSAWGLPWTLWRIAGLAILIPAFVLFFIARVQLGSVYSAEEAESTTLVTTGLYSRIRNPIYLFGSLMILGFIVWSGRPWFLLLFVILIPLQALRSLKEEEVLEVMFGEAYIDYKFKTWF